MIRQRWFRGSLLLCALGLWSTGCEAAEQAAGFAAAQPVWVAGRETEMNLALGFRSGNEHLVDACAPTTPREVVC